MALDLAQRADQRVGVLGQLRRARVGQELARARQRQPDQGRDAPGDEDDGNGEDDRQDGAAATAAAAPIAAIAAVAVGSSRRTALDVPQGPLVLERGAQP